MQHKSKVTLVMGASENPERYSNKAIVRLRQKGHEVLAFGMRHGQVKDVVISNELPKDTNIHTITLYLNPGRQKPFYDFILHSNAKRVIFNPGTENHELERMLEEHDIEYTEACTLVLLSIGDY